MLDEPGGELARALGALSEHGVAAAPCDTLEDAVTMDGDCEAARGLMDDHGDSRAAQPVNPGDAYLMPLRVVGSPDQGSRTVRIRSDAEWSDDDLRNVLGDIAIGQCVRGMGPLKNPALGNAVGYAIRVRDRAGTLCRGYVSDTVVEEPGLTRAR